MTTDYDNKKSSVYIYMSVCTCVFLNCCYLCLGACAWCSPSLWEEDDLAFVSTKKRTKRECVCVYPLHVLYNVCGGKSGEKIQGKKHTHTTCLRGKGRESTRGEKLILLQFWQKNGDREGIVSRREALLLSFPILSPFYLSIYTFFHVCVYTCVFSRKMRPVSVVRATTWERKSCLVLSSQQHT